MLSICVCLAQSVQVKRLALVTLQRWYQLVLHKREVYPPMLSTYLRAWAAYAQRLPLLRFLLLEHMAVKQVRHYGFDQLAILPHSVQHDALRLRQHCFN